MQSVLTTQLGGSSLVRSSQLRTGMELRFESHEAGAPRFVHAADDNAALTIAAPSLDLLPSRPRELTVSILRGFGAENWALDQCDLTRRSSWSDN
jgi:hypothetical protein